MRPRHRTPSRVVSLPVSSLRQSYLRARSLSFDDQLRECVDQLQHPELITAELIQTRAALAQSLTSRSGDESAVPATAGEARRSSPFYATREIFVQSDSSSFTCLADGVLPLSLAGLAGGEGSETAQGGLDYTALTCTKERHPVLGVVQSEIDKSAYPLLLRLLACLCELAHPAQIERLDRHGFHGMLGASPRFDLHVVLWSKWQHEDDVPERTPISQLTHDLAECVKTALGASQDFPPILRDIVCLHMNPERFDARLRFDWRV